MRVFGAAIACLALFACSEEPETPSRDTVSSIVKTCGAFIPLMVEGNSADIASACECTADALSETMQPDALSQLDNQLQLTVERMVNATGGALAEMSQHESGDPRMLASEVSASVTPMGMVALMGFVNTFEPCGAKHGVVLPFPFSEAPPEEYDPEEADKLLQDMIERRD